MILTPTAKSQLAAGAAFWATVWSILSEVDKLAKLLHMNRWVSRERIFDWVDHNRFLAFLCTELINYAKTDLESAAGVTFALGGSIVNAIVIFILFPFRRPIRWVCRKLMFWKTA